MEILPDSLGRPLLSLTGEAASIASKQCIGGWTISISHTGSLAIASAIALSLQPDKVL
jgi:phosphopantetheinyl transferase (holo-ACP synthase)